MSLAPFILKRWLIRFDTRIRITVDRLLPRNLTFRYIAALSAVATLAVLGQIVVQLTFTRQENDQRRIRAVERKVHDSENLREAAKALQLSSDKEEMENHFQVILSLVDRLGIGSTDSEPSPDTPAEAAPELAENERRSRQGMNEDIRLLRSHILASTVSPDVKTIIHVGTVAQDFLNNELLFRQTLQRIAQFYEQRLIRQAVEFHRLELFLMLAMLFLLTIEGLYVFRPAVESLYDALRTRSEFLGRMGHEIRNPMNSIIGMTNLLSETSLTDQQRKYLSTLRKSSAGLLEMLNQLLDFSSVESRRIKLERIPFNLYELLERSIDLSVFGAHAHGIELVLELGHDVPLRLHGDPARLQQVLTNLLGNAVKFTKQGEVVLRVECIPDMGTIQFSVIDTGMGIDQSMVGRIFDPFVQEDSSVRRRFGGTGLGLSIASDLVRLMGGKLAVESAKNIGSRFYFCIGFPEGPGEVARESIDEIVQREQLGPFNAMIVEPNARISESLEGLVRRMGGFTSRVVDSTQLPTLFAKLSRPGEAGRNVFIIDYEFVKNALGDLFSRARRGEADFANCLFLINTTASSEEIEKLAEFGVNNFLFKPVKPLQFIELLGYAITGEKGSKLATPREELAHDSRSLRVLVADDSKDNQFIVKAYLESLPYRLVFADNGLQAVQRFKESRFDIVLMDLQMPEMDGYSAVERIRQWEKSEKLRATPVLAVSAHDHEYESERFLKSGFSGFLLKPINPYRLRREILHLIPEGEARASSKADKPAATASATSIADIEKQLTALGPGYLNKRREELSRLKTLVLQADFPAIATLGHRMKGSAKSYGFEELGRLGARLEEVAQAKNLEQTQATIASIASYIESR